jgi:hypothetical protein
VNFAKDTHLNDDQITRAIVDADDLPISLRKHLSECPQCRSTVEQFENELSILGKLSRHFSPISENKITLPAEKEVRSFLGLWKWRISFGTAFSAIMVILIVWWSGMSSLPINNGPNSPEELWEDEKLMTEISDLSENALPQLYMDITGESDPETEDDFLKFIDPSNEDTSLSQNTGRGKESYNV